MPEISILKLSPSDVDTLLPIAKQTFYDAFYHLTKPSDFEDYSSKAFTTEKFLSEINNPGSVFYFAMVNDQPAGYLKLNFDDAQSELKEKNALEIERIYILKKYQGQQIGKQLIDFSIKTAMDRNLQYVWLGVWEKNPDAIRFYERHGFKIFAKHTFQFGEEQDADWMMKKEIV